MSSGSLGGSDHNLQWEMKEVFSLYFWCNGKRDIHTSTYS